MYGLGQVPFSDIASAWSYITRRVRDVKALPGRLHAKQMEAAAVARVAREAGNTDGEARARELVRQFSALKLEAQDTAQRVSELASRAGLGAVPAVVLTFGAAAIIALAWTVQSLFRRASERERELELLEAGILTPEQVEELRRSIPTGPLAGLAGAARWLAIGAALFVGLPLLTRRRRR